MLIIAHIPYKQISSTSKQNQNGRESHSKSIQYIGFSKMCQFIHLYWKCAADYILKEIFFTTTTQCLFYFLQNGFIWFSIFLTWLSSCVIGASSIDILTSGSKEGTSFCLDGGYTPIKGSRCLSFKMTEPKKFAYCSWSVCVDHRIHTVQTDIIHFETESEWEREPF